MMRGIWLLCVVGLIHWNCNSSYRTLTKSNTDRWNTALEPQKHPLLIISSLFIIYLFFQISPSVSFAHSIPPYFPNCPPLWVTDTWGKMCVCCTGRMLLPSGAIPSASQYAVHNEPRDGTEKNIYQTRLLLNTHLYMKHKNTSATSRTHTIKNKTDKSADRTAETTVDCKRLLLSIS